MTADLGEPYIAEPGAIVIFTAGEYSSYGLTQVGRVLRAADIDALWAEFRPLELKVGFANWLIAAGIIEDVKFDEIWIGYNWKSQQNTMDLEHRRG